MLSPVKWPHVPWAAWQPSSDLFLELVVPSSLDPIAGNSRGQCWIELPILKRVCLLGGLPGVWMGTNDWALTMYPAACESFIGVSSFDPPKSILREVSFSSPFCRSGGPEGKWLAQDHIADKWWNTDLDSDSGTHKSRLSLVTTEILVMSPCHQGRSSLGFQKAARRGVIVRGQVMRDCK